MGNEVELISDGEGLAVIGSPTAVERFMGAVGLSSKDGSPLLGAAFDTGASVAEIGAELAVNSGQWVKLTEESARAVKDFGLMDTTTPGVSHAMIGQPGDIDQWIQVVTSPGAMVANPAMLAGAAGIMAQLAMKQQMDVIMDYLAAIDEKLDGVLRSQTNQALARLDGVDLAVREAVSVREAVGRVSDITWSKVQTSAQTIHETQGYALRQLGDLADKLEEKSKVDDLAAAAKEAERDVQKWLAVLARCFELHDAVGVLELDRVLDASPDELDQHRLGLKHARQERLELISQRTGRLLGRMNEAVGLANSKVLFNPRQPPAVVRSTNHVAAEVHGFHQLLGIESGRESSEARPWADAANERWDEVRETGSQGMDTVRRFGSEGRDQARSFRDKLSERIAERRLGRGDDGDAGSDEQP
ncbi:MAG: hypothetical protein ACXIVQ_03340 [Acidimicrobiales bacterium]